MFPTAGRADADAGREALNAVLGVTLVHQKDTTKPATHLSEFIFQYGNLPFILFLENVIHKGGLTGLLETDRRTVSVEENDGIRMRWDSEKDARKRQY